MSFVGLPPGVVDTEETEISGIAAIGSNAPPTGLSNPGWIGLCIKCSLG